MDKHGAYFFYALNAGYYYSVGAYLYTCSIGQYCTALHCTALHTLELANTKNLHGAFHTHTSSSH